VKELVVLYPSHVRMSVVTCILSYVDVLIFQFWVVFTPNHTQQ